MEVRPFFSIVTVVLNGGKYLERTIQSVINQSFTDFEYIIIDGGSIDKTLEIIQKYEDQIDFWISEKDNGISEAFNKGIKYAKGKYIGFINADDYYTENALEIVSNKAKLAFKEHQVFCGAVDFYDNQKFLITAPANIRRIKEESTIHQSSCFINSALFQKYEKFDLSLDYAMDYELFLRFYMKGISFYEHSEVLSCRDINGITRENGYKALKEFRNIRSKYVGSFENWLNYTYVLIKYGLGRISREYLPFVYKVYWKLSK